MKKEFFFIFSVFACTFYPFKLAAQEVSYRHITVNEGLPSSEVYSLLQDSKGYIWISTDAGVCRFNGRTFTYFTTTDGLDDNTVFRIFEGKNGRIWMICYNGSVCYYENGKISSIAASESIRKLLKNGACYIHSSALDEGDTLWLGTIRMLLKIAPADNYKIAHIDSSIKNNISISIRSFKNGNAVISNKYIFPLKQATSKNVKDRNSIRLVYQSKGMHTLYDSVFLNRSEFIGNPNRKCIYLKNKTLLFSQDVCLFVHKPGKAIQKISFDNTIIFLQQEKNNDLWIGFYKGGVFRFKGGDLNSVPEKYFITKSISDILCDHEGGIWFSSLESGIYYVPSVNYSAYPKSSVLGEKICGLNALGSKVFISLNKNQVLMINPDNTVDSLSVENQALASRAANFYHYHDKLFVVGSKSGVIDTVRKKINYFQPRISSGLALIPFREKDSYLFMDGACLLKLKNGMEESRYESPSRLTCIFKSSDGVIYVGTRTGLYTFSGEKFIQEHRNNGLFKQVISFIDQDQRGRLLIGTKKNGLIVVHQGTVFPVGKKEGLASDICTAVLTDTAGNIWVGTNRGISLLRLNDENKISVIANLNISNGLPSNEITHLARRGNILYIGTKEGLCTIDVSQPFYNTTPPPVFIGSVYLNNKPLTSHTTSEFKYEQNNFRFSIDCMSYKNMFDQSYSYRLLGNDTLWRQSSTGLIEFSNLSPGKYTFEVRGLNNNHLTSFFPVRYSFTISKPFWLSGWFILTELFTGAGIVFLIFKIRFKAIRKKEEEKTRINRLIAESQLLALRSQMNPHFIFNVINSIQNYILKENTRQAYDYLSKFSKLIRMVLSNSKENMLILEQELSTLFLYVELEQFRFDQSFDFLTDIDPGADIENCLIPGMLLQPFVENAIWHGIMPLEGKIRGKIVLTVRADSQQFIISIEDNGIGREESKKVNTSTRHHSMGLDLIHKRLEILNKSNPANKVFQYIVEDLYENNKTPKGTKVTIVIPKIFQDEN